MSEETKSTALWSISSDLAVGGAVAARSAKTAVAGRRTKA